MHRLERVRNALRENRSSVGENETLTGNIPSIDLPSVDMGLNMHQFNGLFESPSPLDHCIGHSGWSLSHDPLS